jgi:hypothetical protein
MRHEADTSDRRIGRRRALAEIAALGAIAWSAPLIVSKPSYAAERRRSNACVAAAIESDQPACGVCQSQIPCGFGSKCGCVVTTNGCCFCHQHAVCDDLQRCKRTDQCPPGYACAYTCCFEMGFGTVCVPPCTGVAISPGSGATTWVQRSRPDTGPHPPG